jgi:peptidoglycan/LPS O-acetylase OafA/YrhL
MNTLSLSNRRHDLDALRAFAMLLGIALHAALSFTGGPWMVQDTGGSNGFLRMLISVVHGFRMPLFFLLSGFFTAMLWQRHGLRALVMHRFKRVFLPLLLGTLTIVPVMFWIGAIAAQSGARRTDDGPPTLWKACVMGDPDRVKSLLEDGVDVNAPDPTLGLTPLGYAALFGRDEIVRLLLDQGADANRRHQDGGTPLHGAAFLGRVQIVRDLLQAGADPQVRNERGETALDLTEVEWDVTKFISRFMKVTVGKDAVIQGRQDVRHLLGAGAHEPKARSWLMLWLFLTQVPLFSHLWFLWFLCWMVAGFVFWVWTAQRVGLRSVPRRWVHSSIRYLWLVPLTLVPAWFMGQGVPNYGPDTSSSILPPFHLLAYYGIFFGYGVLYYDSANDESISHERWWLPLMISLFVLYPLGLAATYGGVHLRLLAILLQVLYVWLMSAGMMALFRRFAARESRWTRYLSDASYWMYLAHLPLVVLAQLCVRDWPLPAGIKFSLICVITFASLLITYEYMVRYTWIGALLNGRKLRTSSNS